MEHKNDGGGVTFNSTSYAKVADSRIQWTDGQTDLFIYLFVCLFIYFFPSIKILSLPLKHDILMLAVSDGYLI